MTLTLTDPRHGKRAGYQMACRCQQCVAANTIYMRHYKRQRRATNAARTPEAISRVQARLHPNGLKRCRWCGQGKTFNMFSTIPSQDDGLAATCNPCVLEQRTLFPRAWAHFRANRAIHGVVYCVYCRTRTATQIDHYQALNHGGSHNLENLVSCCLSCNTSKQDRDVNEWLDANGFTIYEPNDPAAAAMLTAA